MRDVDSSSPYSLPPVTVHLPDGRILRFSQTFHIGRDESCEVAIQDAQISRRHAVVSFGQGHWTIRDLQSRNGLFVRGERVQTADIDNHLEVTFGEDGPLLKIERESSGRMTTPRRVAKPPDQQGDLDEYTQHYFGPTGDDEEVGGRTLMIRRAYQQLRQRQTRRHRWVVAVLAVAGISAGAYAYYSHRQVVRQQALAQELFYSMKALDVDIARVEGQLAGSGNPQAQEQVARYMEQRRQMETNYEQFLTGLYDRRLTEKERQILRVTRMFGECDVAAPPEYIKEVTRYITKWQTTGRFPKAVKLAQDLGYPRRIADEFVKQDLPAQFFYLAMQESDFDRYRNGPPTRMGIAKGMWQFIPETGIRYGLTIGPLAKSTTLDLKDERLNWEKATTAAARYVKDLYATDAQASGLLVMASYNWGEHRVIDLLRTMPLNPRERNFWKLLERYRNRLPPETYDYVFYIVSAAVIGENPRLFGFPFDSPLNFLEQH